MERSYNVGHDGLQLLNCFIVNLAATQCMNDFWGSSAELVEIQILALSHLVDGNITHESVNTAIEDGYLLTYGHRAVLRLNQQLVVLTAAVKGHGCHGIHIA